VAVLYSKNLQPFEKNSNFKYIFLGQNIEKISKKLYQNLYKLDKLNCQKAYILEDEFDNSDLAAALKNRLKKILLS